MPQSKLIRKRNDLRSCIAVICIALAFMFIFSAITVFAQDTAPAETNVTEKTENMPDTNKETVAQSEETKETKVSPMTAAIEKIKDKAIKFKDSFYKSFIKDSRYKHITNGLLVTLEITAVALIIGLVLGVLVAVIRATNEKNGTLKILNAICKVYLTVFRGTPVIVQLLIIYYLWLGRAGWQETYVAMISFGLNSGAYVAEIFRSGIMSIDNGQFEAGRSLGFNYFQTMLHIIMPQAFKNVLPALANEFITLLKETSVASFIAVKDMMKGANVIVGVTYDMNMPYLAVAVIYLVMIVILQKLVSLLERRLRKSEH